MHSSTHAVFLTLLALTGCRDPGGDSGTTDTSVSVPDGDGDGYSADDCNDEDASVNPGAAEICDGLDNDCNDAIDDAPTDAATFYEDADGDGFGDAASTAQGCEAPEGFVADNTDCDDDGDDIYPGATEDDCADPVDYNCDGQVGYADADGDGFPACEDCNDNAAEANPDGTESCDGLDNDCDDEVDEADATDVKTWFADTDGDGFGDPNDSVAACDQPANFVADDTDCDDTSDLAFPGGTEVCDGLDNDCNDQTDEAGATGIKTWYADADGDDYGDADVFTESCAQPDGHVEDKTDCDDAADTINPGATEVCDDADNNCDGAVDEGFDKTWFADSDDDGHGDPDSSTDACTQPDGTVRSSDDCDDTNGAVNPSATEVCNELDDDCNDKADDDDDGLDTSTGTTYFADADSDGFGDPDAGVATCVQPDGRTLDNTDCDDDASGTNPDADEVWYDGTDQNCDGKSDFDQDGDGEDSAAETSSGTDLDDTNPSCSDDCFDGSSQDQAAGSCAGVEGASGMFWIDPNGDGDTSDAIQAYCENDIDGGGWQLVMWTQGGYHRDSGAVSASALGDLSTHAKRSDADIKTIALAGEGEVLIKHATSGTVYVQRYSDAEWDSFSVTGWRNEVYDAKAPDGSWKTDACNGHYNNRGFSTYSDASGSPCRTVFDGNPQYMVTNHTQNYAGGVGNPFGVYLR